MPRTTFAAAHPQTITTGSSRVPVPGLRNLIRGALEAKNIPKEIATVGTSYDSFLFVHTPIRIRVAARGAIWQPCEANTAVLCQNHNRYQIDTTVSREPGHHLWFLFDDLFFDPLLALVQNETGVARFRDPEGVLSSAMRTMVDTVEQDKKEAFWPLQYQGEAVLSLLRKAGRISPGLYLVTRSSGIEPCRLVPRVTAYFQKHLAESISLADIAKAMHVSKSTLSHSYRAETGESPLQTLRRMRIHQVKTLLLQNLNLEAIAQMTGFYDAHHVSREFKRAEGKSPTAFLESLDRRDAHRRAS